LESSITYPASRLKAVLLLLGSVAFVVLGTLMAQQKPALGWMCVAFFGLGIVASILMFVPGLIHLRLDAEGFEMKSLGRKTHRVRWIDVARFQLVSMSGAKMIAIEYRPEYEQQRLMRNTVSKITGVEGAVGNVYAIPLAELERVLNEWLARHGGVADAPVEAAPAFLRGTAGTDAGLRGGA
jgi:hypothetical protein